MKRYLYVFIAIAGLVLIGLAAYYFLTNTFGVAVTPAPTPSGGLPPTTMGPGGSVTPGTLLPPAPPAPTYTGGQKFGVVAENQVAAFSVDAQNNTLIVQPDGQVVKIVNGSATTLNSSPITNLTRAGFSPGGAKIAVTFGDRSNPQASIFDVSSKSWQPLPVGMQSPAWAPSGTQIMYFQKNGDVSTLATLDLTKPNSKPVELAKLHLEDHAIQWISPNQVLFLPKGSAWARDAVWSFDVKNKTMLSITGDRPGIDSIWSGSANRGLVFVADQSARGGKLTLFDTAGNALSGLSILTLPSKCAFDVEVSAPAQTPPSLTTPSATSSKPTSSAQAGAKTTPTKTPLPPAPVVKKFLYCAVPQDSQKLSMSKLPDSYQKRALFTVDNFYKINVDDGSIAQISADQNYALDATNLLIANQTLFFVNRYDQKLYAISLK